jgi:hypothetical protein
VPFVAASASDAGIAVRVCSPVMARR